MLGWRAARYFRALFELGCKWISHQANPANRGQERDARSETRIVGQLEYHALWIDEERSLRTANVGQGNAFFVAAIANDEAIASVVDLVNHVHDGDAEDGVAEYHHGDGDAHSGGDFQKRGSRSEGRAEYDGRTNKQESEQQGYEDSLVEERRT